MGYSTPVMPKFDNPFDATMPLWLEVDAAAPLREAAVSGQPAPVQLALARRALVAVVAVAEFWSNQSWNSSHQLVTSVAVDTVKEIYPYIGDYLIWRCGVPNIEDGMRTMLPVVGFHDPRYEPDAVAAVAGLAELLQDTMTTIAEDEIYPVGLRGAARRIVAAAHAIEHVYRQPDHSPATDASE
ncbi:hypothetical protein [Nocardia brasiliensis]|uniref:hypothetical protein n=1 Tax=Nocardia brasiliensis TaxID=37326 RepID=UPI0024571EE7|nr:hypothetical protein [Nocardia brasiliensis]